MDQKIETDADLSSRNWQERNIHKLKKRNLNVTSKVRKIYARYICKIRICNGRSKRKWAHANKGSKWEQEFQRFLRKARQEGKKRKTTQKEQHKEKKHMGFLRS